MNIDPDCGSAAIRPADVDLLVSGYCSAWNEPDPKRRLRRLEAVCRAHATFDSAAVRLRGLGAIDAHIGEFRTDARGWRFVVADVTAHGRHVHLTWRLLDAAGVERLCGHDVGECSDDRRFDRIVSFWREGAAASLAGRQSAPRLSGT